MKIFSFDTNLSSKRVERETDTGLFDLFRKNIINSYDIELKYYIVPREYEMRLDRISEFLYGSPNYVEELMVINNIINPYSIKQGQYIYHCSLSDLNKLYTNDELSNEKEKSKKQLIASNKNKNKEFSTDGILPLTIKPGNLEQIKMSNDYTIQIINSFE